MKRMILAALVFAAYMLPLSSKEPQTDNKASSVEAFIDMGFGMFIHWSVDSQLGAVISHSLSGSSQDYRDRFFNELPKTFNPKKFDPDSWASLAKLAGMKYVVFTAKHHSGFCMFETDTTPFNIMNTPFRRDATREILDAFRKQDIAVGLYFSPEDFYMFNKQGVPVGRLQNDMHYPVNNRELMEYDKRQIKELLTNYGKIDVLFFDGPAEELKEYAWSLQPDIMVTRGHINTPEQNTPDSPMPGPWEACYTMGTDWQYKPTNDPHKSGNQIIRMLIELKAKGGNFLLNVGPKPDGEIQIEQEARLQEVALWHFANGEAMDGTRPWEITHEGDTWFTASKDGNTVYAFVTDPWPYGSRKEMILKAVKARPDTKVSILGYDSQLVEYRKDFDASLRFEDTSIGLVISAVNGQRFYTNNKWENPVVLKLENVDYRASKKIVEKRDSMDGAL